MAPRAASDDPRPEAVRRISTKPQSATAVRRLLAQRHSPVSRGEQGDMQLWQSHPRHRGLQGPDLPAQAQGH